MNDVEETLLGAFEHLKHIAKTANSPTKEMEMGARLAALIAALRDVYPNIPIEEKSIAVALIEANSPYQMQNSIALGDAISKLVLECPNQNGEKIDTMFFMVAPEHARRAKFS